MESGYSAAARLSLIRATVKRVVLALSITSLKVAELSATATLSTENSGAGAYVSVLGASNLVHPTIKMVSNAVML